MKVKCITLVSMAILSGVLIAKPNAKEIRFGGFVDRPVDEDGRVVFVNAQHRVPADKISSLIRDIVKLVHAKLEFVDKASVGGQLTGADVSKFKAKAAIFIVDDSKCQNTLLIAPEDRWAQVNVAAITADNPGTSFVECRTRKEIIRAFLLLCGGADSSYPNSLMSYIKRPSDLDKIADDMPPMDVLTRVFKVLPKMGVATRTRCTYRQACIEGWAPPPTNDIQRAVWERVKADKERGPVKPITIKPPAKK